MNTKSDGVAAPVPAFRLVPDEARTAGVPVSSEFIPLDAYVLWEWERADRYKRVFALIVGNKLKLLKISAGNENSMEIMCEAVLEDEPATLRTQFLTRDALVLWAEPRVPQTTIARTLVLRVGSRLKLLRVTGDESAPSIEILQTVDAG